MKTVIIGGTTDRMLLAQPRFSEMSHRAGCFRHAALAVQELRNS